MGVDSHTLEGAKPPHLKKLPRPQISRKPSSPRGGGGDGVIV